MQRPPPSVVAVASMWTAGTNRMQDLLAVAERSRKLSAVAVTSRTGAELAPHVAALAAMIEEVALIESTHAVMVSEVGHRPPPRRHGLFRRLWAAWGAFCGWAPPGYG